MAKGYRYNNNVYIYLIGLYITTLPFFQLWSVYGIARPDWLVGGVIILVSFALFLSRGLKRPNKIEYSVLIFVVVCSFSALSIFNETKEVWWQFSTLYPQLLFYVFVFFGIVNLRPSVDDVISVMNVWYFCAAILSLYALYQIPARVLDLPYDNILYGQLLTPGLSESKEFALMRANSLFNEPDDLGAYLVPPLVWGVVSIGSNKSSVLPFKSKYLERLSAFVVALALAVTFSMASYLTVAGIIGAFIILRTPVISTFWLFKVMLPAIILSVFVISFLRFGYLDWFSNRLMATLQLKVGAAGSLGVRLESWANIIKTWKGSPLFGTGVGVYESSRVVRRIGINTLIGKLLATTGLVGLLAFLSIGYQSVASLYRLSMRYISVVSVVATSLMFIIIGEFIRAIGSSSFLHPRIWLLFAFASSLYYGTNK